jgi:predicted lactoylglutathione lyase
MLDDARRPPMGRMIFPHLPVKDVAASRAFWTRLGFTFDEDFCSGDAACLVINDLANVMLLREDFFHAFHDTRPHTGTETTICLTATGREDVDRLCSLAGEAGAQVTGRLDEPPMYGGSFRDPDGHIWEVLWMETS